MVRMLAAPLIIRNRFPGFLYPRSSPLSPANCFSIHATKTHVQARRSGCFVQPARTWPWGVQVVSGSRDG
jgi:hypothetical protein